MKKSAELRRSKNVRLMVMLALIVILAIMWFVFEKFRLWILALIGILLVAVGMEVTENDFDVQKLIETGSFAESRVNVTENGTWLIGACQERVNFNCDNFTYQEEAQQMYEDCGGVENDIHGLDRDKDGIVCESNKKRPEGEEARSLKSIFGIADEPEASEEAVTPEAAPAQ